MDVYSLEAMMHTGPIPAIVTADLTLTLVLGSDLDVPMPASFNYSAHEPLAVTVDFVGTEASVQWVFARDLLQGGMTRPVGEGDVTCWPGTNDQGHVVCIALRSPTGEALLEAPADDVAAFLRRSYEVVPEGCEGDHLDIDDLIAELLSEPGA
ncbi:MAG: SsgA family sporulation/cell division regulator [Candidatus Nanopelagicales bacterium]